MLKHSRKQGAKSSLGFSLTVADAHGYLYRENGKTMRVDIEPFYTRNGHYYEDILEGSFSSWLPPHDSVHISPENKKRIKANVKDCLDFLGTKHQFVREAF